ncbi:EAL domain-containing protein [Enterobacteriaceae bacterium 4M9]|nr:EAL domain-containing protein [Enterobacteriaceae bacterium 4M9]
MSKLLLPPVNSFRLEPCMDINSGCLYGYEVLPVLPSGYIADTWFSQQGAGYMINLLRIQIESVRSVVTTERLFFNLSIDGFVHLSINDIRFISEQYNICLEVSDFSLLKYFSAASRSRFISQMMKVRRGGTNVWVDGFCLEDLMSMDDIRNNFDGIKLARSELLQGYLNYEAKILIKHLPDLPLLIEGIENKKDLQQAAKAGIGLGQGYYWQENNLFVS